MPNQQKYRPISFRPPEADRLWLMEYASRVSRPVNAILAEALAQYRERHRHVIHCRGCGQTWTEDEGAADSGCSCTCSDPADRHYEDWAVED